MEVINLKKNFEFTTLANSEILLILSPILRSDNFGSQLNLFSLLVFFIVSFKYNKSFIFFIFSCPLIVFLLSTQKLQLFFGILYLVLFILVHQNLLKKKIEIFVFILLLAFYVVIRLGSGKKKEISKSQHMSNYLIGVRVLIIILAIVGIILWLFL